MLSAMGIKPGPKRIAISTGKPDRRQRDNKKTPGNTPTLKPHHHKRRLSLRIRASVFLNSCSDVDARVQSAVRQAGSILAVSILVDDILDTELPIALLRLLLSHFDDFLVPLELRTGCERIFIVTVGENPGIAGATLQGGLFVGRDVFGSVYLVELPSPVQIAVVVNNGRNADHPKQNEDNDPKDRDLHLHLLVHDALQVPIDVVGVLDRNGSALQGFDGRIPDGRLDGDSDIVVNPSG